MWSERLVLGAVGLLFSGSTWAGACCMGATSVTPARVGRCEKATAGVMLGATQTVGTWDRDGVPRPSSLTDIAMTGSVAGGLRFSPQWQLGVALPVRLNHRASASQDLWALGAGDVGLSALWEPLDERVQGITPLFSAGFSVPSGRGVDDAQGVLQEDVTGAGQATAQLGASVEQVNGQWPWSIGVDSKVGVGALGARPLVAAHMGVGRYFGGAWSLGASVRHARSRVSADAVTSARTSVGGAAVRGRPMGWRAWVGVNADVGLPGLGQSSARARAVTAGWLKVF